MKYLSVLITKVCLLLFISICYPTISQASDIIWDGSDDELSIGKLVEILEDKKGKLSFEEACSAAFGEKYTLSESEIISLGYTDSYFWLRFTIDNKTPETVSLELSQAGLPKADLYYKNKNSVVKHLSAGYEIGIDNKEVRSSYQVFRLPPGKIVYYIRINTNSEPVPIKLYKQKAFVKASTTQIFAYGIYLGLMLYVVLNNLIIFVSLRNRLHLFYALVVIIYIAYSAIVIDGFIVYFVPNVNLKFLYSTIPAIGITVQTTYCLVFLEARKYAPKIYKAVSAIIIYFGVWMLVKFFLPFSIIQPINTVNALLSFFIMCYVGIRVGLYGNKIGFYFAIAYLFYFVLVATQAIYINTGTPKYIGGISYVAYATLIESFLLSFLLARKIEIREKRN